MLYEIKLFLVEIYTSLEFSLTYALKKYHVDGGFIFRSTQKRLERQNG